MASAQRPVPQRLPAPQPNTVMPGLTIVTPQSRKGSGPGLIVLVNEAASGLSIEQGVPSVFMKWAEEGYCVAEVTERAWENSSKPLQTAAQELAKSAAFDFTCGIGLICYEPELLQQVVKEIQSTAIVAMVCYGSSTAQQPFNSIHIPVLWHLTGNKSDIKAEAAASNAHFYSKQESAYFATSRTPDFDYSTEAISHSRSLAFLKKQMGGPYFDLEDIWDEHTYYEFENRSVENTMNTMVAEPYVNHVPTLTGGVGYKELSNFYQNHFIFSNPDDAELELISRTTGIDRIVDEFIYKCTHDRTIDWLLPGVPPTNTYIEIPMMAVVNIRGDRLYHEHITWDHATALRQVGHLPEYVPLAHINGNDPSSAPQTNGVKNKLKLPVIGKEGAAKLRDRRAYPSNEMFSWGIS